MERITKWHALCSTGAPSQLLVEAAGLYGFSSPNGHCVQPQQILLFKNPTQNNWIEKHCDIINHDKKNCQHMPIPKLYSRWGSHEVGDVPFKCDTSLLRSQLSLCSTGAASPAVGSFEIKNEPTAVERFISFPLWCSLHLLLSVVLFPFLFLVCFRFLLCSSGPVQCSPLCQLNKPILLRCVPLPGVSTVIRIFFLLHAAFFCMAKMCGADGAWLFLAAPLPLPMAQFLLSILQMPIGGGGGLDGEIISGEKKRGEKKEDNKKEGRNKALGGPFCPFAHRLCCFCSHCSFSSWFHLESIITEQGSLRCCFEVGRFQRACLWAITLSERGFKLVQGNLH